MKKIVILLAATLLTMLMVSSAFAEVTLTGEIKQWNWYRDNIQAANLWLYDLDSDGICDKGECASLLLPTKTSSSSFSMMRVRLAADIKVSDNVKGMIELESQSGPEGGTSDFYTWGTLNEKQSDVNLRQAWLQYTGSGLLGVPAGIKTGHMGLILGLGKFLNLTRYGTDAIVLFVDPTKQLHIGLLTAKVNEGSTSDNTDDSDAYVGLLAYKIDDKSTVGTNWTYINNSDLGTKMHNLMLYMDGSSGNVDYKAELDFQFGDTSKDVHLMALGAYLGAGYKFNPITLRASVAKGSGDDIYTDDVETFQTFLGPDMNVAWIYEYQLTPAGMYGANLSSNTAGISGTWYYNLGLDYQATKDMALSLDGYQFWAMNGWWELGSTVGSEVDAKLVYNISKGLKWTILAGVFSPGEFYDDMWGYEKKTVTAARSDITLSF